MPRHAADRASLERLHGRPRQRRLTGAERRLQLLDAARQVLQQGGIQAVTMERVAEHADISKPVLYSHFANRDELLIAMLEQFWTALDDAIRQRTSRDDPFEKRLETIVLCYFDVLDTHGQSMYSLVIRGTHEPAVEAARTERMRSIERLWAKELDADLGVDPEKAGPAAALIRSNVAAAGEYYLVTGARRDVCIDTCLTLIRGGLRELRDAGAGEGA